MPPQKLCAPRHACRAWKIIQPGLGVLIPRRRLIAYNDPSSSLVDEPQHVSEFRMRWSQRLEKRTDDSALKSRLLESLVDAYRTPLSVLPDRDLKAVKDEFLEGDLGPVQFLEKLQSLPRCSE